MKTNSELKNRAIDALTGNWGLGAVITLVYGLVMNAPTLPYRIMESVATSSFGVRKNKMFICVAPICLLICVF